VSARLDIINFALSLLGAEAITSLADDAPEAKAMSRFYYIAKDSVLSECEWTFATRRFLPAKETTAPAWGWASAFPIPSDILRVTRVDRTDYVGLGTGMTRHPADYAVEGRKILCNEDVIYCAGIRRIEDEGIYSPMFAEAFSYKLAAQACLLLTESNSKMQMMAGLYTEAIGKAKSRDGLQGTSRRLRNQTLSRVRY